MSLREFPADERPREKMLEKGASALSDAELLAIFFRTGIVGMNAIELGREVLRHFGGLRPMLDASAEEFTDIKGIGAAKFVQLQAALELGKRYLEQSLIRDEAFTSPERVGRYLQAQLRSHQREVFAALFLDSQHRLIQYRELFYGTLDSAAVYPREVVKEALRCNAGALIFAHNHPSGVAEPSQADRSITLRLRDALSLVDIRVLDHLVVGDCEVVSLAARGML
ncbi:DNA repair protein [gamma proteobacterium HdN1]|nr:DNA repair protein [gamma proteobacterium HdN1]